MATIGEIAGGLNGHISGSQAGSEHQSFVTHMTLIQYDTDLTAVPYLAESWDVSEDRTGASTVADMATKSTLPPRRSGCTPTQSLRRLQKAATGARALSA